MPAARDYQCKSCHFEFEMFQDTFEESPGCPACGEGSVWVPSFYYSRPRTAAGFSPVVIHQNEAGETRYPAYSGAPVPAGFTRVELGTISAVRQFEREVNSRENERIVKDDYNRRVTIDQEIISNREAIREGVMVRDRENPDRVKRMRLEDFSPRGRQFYETMAKQADEKRAKNSGRARAGAGFHLEAFSNNASNREAYRDAGNDWGRSGARK